MSQLIEVKVPDIGGFDAVRNLLWLPGALKSCPGTVCKDRWERKVYVR